MPTDNPKISSYVPQQIYDRFKEYQKEQDLSMSQAMIVILAEYFGIEETLKEISSSSPIGGVTLEAFKDLQKRLKIVEIEVEQLKSTQVKMDSSRVESQVENTKSTDKEENDINDKPTLKLLSEPPQQSLVLSGKELAERLKVSSGKLSSTKNRLTMDEFKKWSSDLDPDNFEWTYKNKEKGKGVLYVALSNTTE